MTFYSPVFIFHNDYVELQLKSYHQPVRLYKNWRQLLTQYTTIPKEQCINGTTERYMYSTYVWQWHIWARTYPGLGLDLPGPGPGHHWISIIKINLIIIIQLFHSART